MAWCIHHTLALAHSRGILVNPRGMSHKYNRVIYSLCPYCYEMTFLSSQLSRHSIPHRSLIVTHVTYCDLTLSYTCICAYHSLTRYDHGILHSVTLCYSNYELTACSYHRSMRQQSYRMPLPIWKAPARQGKGLLCLGAWALNSNPAVVS